MANSSNNNGSKTGLVAIIVALIGLLGVVIAFFGGERAAVREIIKATATAEHIYLLTQVPQVNIPLSEPTRSVNTIVTEGDISLPATSTSTPAPTLKPASTPVPQGELISIAGFEENGIKLNFSESGLYDIAYSGGAYSGWPNDDQPDNRGWSVSFLVYVNRPVEWGITDYGLPGPINEDFYVGPGGFYPTQQEAIKIAQGSRAQVRVSAGDFVTVALVDEQGRYGDNRGQLDLLVTYLRP